MHVCFICVEIFAWGKYGGFGRATRLIGRELVKRGVTVSAVVPRRKGQMPVENLDGIQVYGFSKREILSSKNLYHSIDADIYHSEEPSLGSYLALRAVPDRKHIVTFRDTRNKQDWLTEFKLPSYSRTQVIINYLYEDNYLVRKAVRKADGCYCASNLLIPKAQIKYQLKQTPLFLPTPVEMPLSVKKSPHPTVCFISRWDRRKRPEIFFELARQFPEVEFIAIGSSRDTEWDQYLREKYCEIPNLQMTGFIDQFNSAIFSEILSRSWILVNTSPREGLPISFIEASAHQCAILSTVNPDGFASRFGYWVQDQDYSAGLSHLLKDGEWQVKGQLGCDYVRENFEINAVIEKHLEIYQKTLGLPG